jgi:mono/diheme cytochrome c family protein
MAASHAPKGFTRRFPTIIGLALLAAAAVAWAAARQDPSGSQGERGRTLYASRCAACHGAELQGQPDWRHVNARGRLPAPPLDSSGHAWRHSDAELAHLVQFSVIDLAGPGYETDMPAFGKDLPNADIRALVAYIKSRWTPNVQAAQAFLNPDHAGMPTKVDSDWRLPADCDEPVRRAVKPPAQKPVPP